MLEENAGCLTTLHGVLGLFLLQLIAAELFARMYAGNDMMSTFYVWYVSSMNHGIIVIPYLSHENPVTVALRAVHYIPVRYLTAFSLGDLLQQRERPQPCTTARLHEAKRYKF